MDVQSRALAKNDPIEYRGEKLLNCRMQEPHHRHISDMVTMHYMICALRGAEWILRTSIFS